MKTITNDNEISTAFESFKSGHDGAEATGRLVEGADSAFDPQEWAEHGEINGSPAKIYYMFDAEEASSESAEDYPWDADHIFKIEVAEQDESGDFDQP